MAAMTCALLHHNNINGATSIMTHIYAWLDHLNENHTCVMCNVLMCSVIHNITHTFMHHHCVYKDKCLVWNNSIGTAMLPVDHQCIQL